MIIDLVPEATQNAESAETVASIDDLLIDILLHLPVKPLIRFKVVSKHWNSLIINPIFGRRHNPNPDPYPAVGLFLPRTDYWNYPFHDYVSLVPEGCAISPLKFTEYGFNIQLMHSCNGLLLCSGFNSRKSSDKYYFVHNPTTNQVSNLPKLDGIVFGMSLAFDPVKSLDRYKVVCVCHYPYQIYIYSSETGAWRRSGAPSFYTRVDFEDGVYWNGAVHWMSEQHLNEDSLYFNIDDQMLKKMPIVPMDISRRACNYFGESCNHLHYFEICYNKIQFNVYEMKRDYSEWFVKYHVDLSAVASANPWMISSHHQLFLGSIIRVGVEEEDDDSFLAILWIPGKAIRYNLVSKTFQELHGSVDPKSHRCKPRGFQYIPSLCCV